MLQTRVPRSVAACIVFLCALGGCRGRNHDVIAVIPRTTGLPLWEAERTGVSEAARNKKLRIHWNAPTREDDVERQIELVQRVIADRNVGLILAPDQALALMTPVRRAVEAGIPTVVVSSPLSIPAGGHLSYILNDDEATGQIAARRIAMILKGRGSVAVLGIDPDIRGIMTRVRAFESTLRSEFPAIRIVAERTGTFNGAEAQQIANDTLRSHPEIDALLTLTATATRGAYISLKNGNTHANVKIVGCDQDTDLVDRIREGNIDSLVAENTYDMGYKAVHLIAAQIAGEPVVNQTVLPPLLVTRENVDTPEVQKMLNLQWWRE